MLIVQDTCSNENNNFVYVQQTFKRFETFKYMGKQNLIILEENCTSDSFQALHNLQIPIWSFKAKKYV